MLGMTGAFIKYLEFFCMCVCVSFVCCWCSHILLFCFEIRINATNIRSTSYGSHLFFSMFVIQFTFETFEWSKFGCQFQRLAHPCGNRAHRYIPYNVVVQPIYLQNLFTVETTRINEVRMHRRSGVMRHGGQTRQSVSNKVYTFDREHVNKQLNK